MGYDLLPENKYVLKPTLNLHLLMWHLCSICNRGCTVISGFFIPHDEDLAEMSTISSQSYKA